MKLLKSRIVIGTLCIIVALILCFFAVPSLQGSQSTRISVIRLTKTIQAGTKISAEMVETVKIPQNIIQGGIGDASSVVGRYANTELYAGDYLSNEKISATPAEQNALIAGIPKGKTVISITIPSLAAGVSGRLKPGDVVTILAMPKSTVNQSTGVEPDTTGESTSTGAVIYPELHYIEVCMIAATDGSDSSVAARPDKDTKNNLPVTVSFFTDEAQALRLVELEQKAILHIAFVARGDDASKYIPNAQRVFNTEVK